MPRKKKESILISPRFKIRRGDIIYANLGEEEDVVGSEQYGIRPVVVTQCNRNNKNSTTYIVAVITSALKRIEDPCHVLLPRIAGLPKQSMVCCEQRFTLDRKRFIKFKDRLSGNVMKKITRACHKAEEEEKRRRRW